MTELSPAAGRCPRKVMSRSYAGPVTCGTGFHSGNVGPKQRMEGGHGRGFESGPADARGEAERG